MTSQAILTYNFSRSETSFEKFKQILIIFQLKFLQTSELNHLSN